MPYPCISVIISCSKFTLLIKSLLFSRPVQALIRSIIFHLSLTRFHLPIILLVIYKSSSSSFLNTCSKKRFVGWSLIWGEIFCASCYADIFISHIRCLIDFHPSSQEPHFCGLNFGQIIFSREYTIHIYRVISGSCNISVSWSAAQKASWGCRVHPSCHWSLKALMTIITCVVTSFWHLPSYFVIDPNYLKEPTCSKEKFNQSNVQNLVIFWDSHYPCLLLFDYLIEFLTSFFHAVQKVL